MSEDRTPTQILSAMAEEATPELLKIALNMAYSCADCGVEQKRHPQRDCAVWKRQFGPMDMVRLIDMTVALSRHEGVRDRELGLDKKVEPVMVGFVGIDLLSWKAMTQEEQDRALLDRIGAIDVEPIGQLGVSERAPNSGAVPDGRPVSGEGDSG